MINVLDNISSFLISKWFLFWLYCIFSLVLFLLMIYFIQRIISKINTKITYNCFFKDEKSKFFQILSKIFEKTKLYNFYINSIGVIILILIVFYVLKLNSFIIWYVFKEDIFQQTNEWVLQVNHLNFDQLYIQNNKEKENSEIIIVKDKEDSNFAFIFDLRKLIQNKIILKNTFNWFNNEYLIYNINKENFKNTFFHWIQNESIDFFNTYWLHSKKILNNNILNDTRKIQVSFEEFDELYNLNNISYSEKELEYSLKNNLIKIAPAVWFEFTDNYISKSYNWWDELRNIIEKLYWNTIKWIYYEYTWKKQNWTFDIQTFITIFVYWLLFFSIIITLKQNRWNLISESEYDDVEVWTEQDLWNIVEMWWNDDLIETLEEICKLNSIIWWTKLKWILLYWPPWTWKTLFWKQIAKKLWIPFKYISSWSLLNKFVWESQKIIKTLFQNLREELQENWIKQCILFLDELDSIWENKDSFSWQFSKDWLNQILTEIDWFKKEDWIIIIWATNRFESLEQSLISRFDYKFFINLPDKKWREDIIKNQLKYLYSNTTQNWYITINWIFHRTTKIKNWILTKWDYTNIFDWSSNFRFKSFWKKIQIIDKDIIENKKIISKYSLLMEWFSWRDIQKVIDILYNKSILEEKKIDDNMIWKSIEEFIMWKDKKRKFDDDQLKIIAYHELWHAIISKYIWKIIAQISIAAKSMSLWQTFSISEKDKILISEWDYINEVYTLLWWRAAEKLYLWEITSWSQNDYERATNILKSFILLNFEYQPKNIEEIKKRLWINFVDKIYKLWYVCKFEDLSNTEKTKLFEMIKIILCDCEINVERILLKHDKTMKYYFEKLIKELVIIWENFKFIQ